MLRSFHLNVDTERILMHRSKGLNHINTIDFVAQNVSVLKVFSDGRFNARHKSSFNRYGENA